MFRFCRWKRTANRALAACSSRGRVFIGNGPGCYIVSGPFLHKRENGLSIEAKRFSVPAE